VVWGRLGYGQEGSFRWTRPTGTMLVPVDPEGDGAGPAGPLRLRIKLATDAVKEVKEVHLR
jgi:hypothetical protein